MPRGASEQDQLAIQNLRFDLALNNMSQGLCFFDGVAAADRLQQALCRAVSARPRDRRPGITLREIVDLRHAAARSRT
jgi:hypothetical protein